MRRLVFSVLDRSICMPCDGYSQILDHLIKIKMSHLLMCLLLTMLFLQDILIFILGVERTFKFLIVSNTHIMINYIYLILIFITNFRTIDDSI